MDARVDLEKTGVLVWATAVAGRDFVGPQPVAALSDSYYDFCDENDHVGQIDSVIGFGRRLAGTTGWHRWRTGRDRGYVVPRSYLPDVNLWTPTLRTVGRQVGRMAPATWGAVDAYRQYVELVESERALELSFPMFLTTVGLLLPGLAEVEGDTIVRRPL